MYKVFANRLPIILTSDKNYLDNPNTYLLSSISNEEIIKKLKIKKEKNKDAAIREVTEETGIKKLKIDKFFEKTFHIINV